MAKSLKKSRQIKSKNGHCDYYTSALWQSQPQFWSQKILIKLDAGVFNYQKGLHSPTIFGA